MMKLKKFSGGCGLLGPLFPHGPGEIAARRSLEYNLLGLVKLTSVGFLGTYMEDGKRVVRAEE